MLLGAVVDHRRRLMSQNEQALFGIEKLKVARSQIPAVTHVDCSACVQTVHADTKLGLPPSAQRVQRAHRLPGSDRYQLQ
jgi:hypothetical protein